MDGSPNIAEKQSEKESAFMPNDAILTEMPKRTTTEKSQKDRGFIKNLGFSIVAIPAKFIRFMKVSEPRWRTSVATLLLVALFVAVLLYGGSPSSAASFTFVQNSWSGGTSASVASHPADQTGWNKYVSQNRVNLTTGNVTISTFDGQTIENPEQNTKANSDSSVSKATLNVTEGTGSGSYHYEMSNNGGSTWERVRLGVEHTFAAVGTDLRWRAVPYSLAAPAQVQSALGQAPNQTGGGTISGTITLNNVTPGNLIVIGLSQNSTSGTFTVTDNRSNTYTSAVSRAGSNASWKTQIFFAKNVTGGNTTITISSTVAATSLFGSATEVSGADTASPLAITGSYEDSVAATTHPCSDGLNTEPNVFIFCGAGFTGAGGSTANANYTGIHPPNVGYMWQYRSSSSALTNETGAWNTGSNNRTAVSVMATFRTGGLQAPQMVKSAVGTSTSEANVTLTGVTAGNLIVLNLVKFGGGQGRTYTVSDNRGNTYSEAVSVTSNDRISRIYYAKNVAAGDTTVTVTQNPTDSFAVIAMEISGASPTSPLDAVSSFTNAAGPQYCGEAGQIDTVANVFVYCGGYLDTDTGSVIASSGYTRIHNDVQGQRSMFQYKTSNTALTDERPVWTQNGTQRPGSSVIASFKAEARSVTSSTITYSGMYTAADLISSPFNTGDAGNLVAKIAWSATGTSVTQTVRMQIRTSPDGTTWTGWCGAADTGTSCTGNNYFSSAQNDVNIASTNPVRSGGDDQWFQYKIILAGNGTATPSVSSVTVTYVVNAPPQFDTDAGLAAAQDIDPESNTLNKVLITYSIRDVDSTTGTSTPGFVTPTFQYNIGGGWVNIGSQYLASGDGDNKAVDESNYTTYSATWDAASQIPDNLLDTARVRITINDNEAANNTATLTSEEFTLDTTDPVLTAFTIDASQGIIRIEASDDNNLFYRISNNINMSADGRNESSGQWQEAGGNSIDLSPAWNFAPIPNHYTVYLEVRDAYGNTSSATAISPNVPSPNAMFIKDISNVEGERYNEFVSWQVYEEEAGSLFDRYEIYRSTDGDNFTLQSTITDINVNYYADFDLEGGTTYHYKIRTVDTDGDIGGFSEVVSDTADGQGGTDNSAPQITNIQVADVQSTTATITWTTDELSDSRVDYSIAPDITFLVGQAVSSFVTSHSVTLRNLTPNTTYLFRVKSNDPLGNSSTKDNDGAGYTFTTVSGPVISGVTETSVSDHTATIFWTTNIDSDSFVNYSTDPSLANPTQVGSAALVGGSSPHQHTVKLTGLEAGTTYYYSVQSTDEQNNTTVDTNGGQFYSFITTTDTAAPEITGIDTPVIAPTAAVIIWQTDELATTQADWGLESENLNQETELIETLSIFHVVSLTGLEENTKYYFRVKSQDDAGNETISDVHDFTTGETTIIQQVGGGGGGSSVTLDTTAPSISGIVTNNVTSFNAEVAFTTNEDTIGIVEYGKTEDFGFTASSADFGQQHNIQLRGLTMGTEYFYRVKAVDKGGNTKTEIPAKFQTKFFTEGGINIEDAAQFQAQVEEAIESALPSLVPPFIDRPEVVDVTPDGATVRWRTNIRAYSVLSYAEASQVAAGSTQYPNEASNTSDKVTQHEIKLVNLKPNTTYRILPKSFSIPGAVGQGREQTFTTRSLPIQGRVTEVTNNSFRASWSTPAPTSTIVQYRNMTTNEVLQKTDAALNTNHTMVIENLTPATSYEVRVYGYTAQNNIIEGGAPVTITTSQDSQAPEISGLKIETALVPGRQDRTQTIVAWKTNEPATSIVRYEEGTGAADRPLANKVEITNNTVTEHTVILSTLKPGGIYRIQIESTDLSGNTTTFPVRTIVVPRQSESILDVIFKNFEDTFKFLRQ